MAVRRIPCSIGGGRRLERLAALGRQPPSGHERAEVLPAVLEVAVLVEGRAGRARAGRPRRAGPRPARGRDGVLEVTAAMDRQPAPSSASRAPRRPRRSGRRRRSARPRPDAAAPKPGPCRVPPAIRCTAAGRRSSSATSAEATLVALESLTHSHAVGFGHVLEPVRDARERAQRLRAPRRGSIPRASATAAAAIALRGCAARAARSRRPRTTARRPTTLTRPRSASSASVRCRSTAPGAAAAGRDRRVARVTATSSLPWRANAWSLAAR